MHSVIMMADAGGCIENRRQIAHRSALERMVDVEVMANAVDFLTGDGSKNITGTIITVDAGNTA
jgi:3-oxoacyl-[acyl-carrier protein] reductase